MNKTEFIGKLQLVYVGDRNAFNEIVGEYDRLNNIINELEKILLEKIDAIKTIKITLGEDGANAVTPNIDLFEKEYRYFLNKLKELKDSDKE